MTNRDARLHQFFAGYFNQDWDVSGASSWSEVVDEYLVQNPRDSAMTLRDDLESWLAEGQLVLPAAFGCDYDPRTGDDDATWIRQVVDYLTTKLC